MKRLLLIVAVVIVGALGAGCGTRDSKLVGPTPDELLLRGDPTADDGTLHFRFKTVYTACGTYYCDYPSDFVGPIPQGHARIGSTSTSLCP